MSRQPIGDEANTSTASTGTVIQARGERVEQKVWVCQLRVTSWVLYFSQSAENSISGIEFGGKP